MFRLRVLALAVAATACGGPAAVSSPSAESGGSPLFERYCALCHGKAAVGYAADNASQLQNPTFLRTASDQFLRVAITRGRPGTPMSAFGSEHGGPLDSKQIEQLIAYLRSLDDGAPIDVHGRRVTGNTERGTALYRQRCASCHGESGQGKTALSLSSPTFVATASPGFIRYAIEHGRPGTRMPAFGALLSPQEIDDVTLAVRGFVRVVDQQRAAPAATALPKLDQIVIHPNGPRPQFSLRDGRFVSVDQLAAALGKGSRLVVLDARPLSDWHLGHIPGAYPMPFHEDVDSVANALPRDGTWIVAYCACPHAASGKVIDALRARGFENTAVLDEGIKVWEERGHPMRSSIAK
jgi:mono/diheme cytochrome c family protein/rhodanese-related sulfurtransferase